MIPRTEMDPTNAWPKKASEAILVWNGDRFLIIARRNFFGIDLKLDNDYRNRIVGTRNELREKLVILDEGLDDHVIELMKLIMKVHLQSNDQNLKIEEFLFDIDQEGTRFFAINLGNGEWGHTDFVQDMYDSIAEDMKDIIENDDEVVVDFNWALAAIQKDKR